MCVLSIKVPIRKKSGNLFNDPRIYIKGIFTYFNVHILIIHFVYSIYLALSTSEVISLYKFTHRM